MTGIDFTSDFGMRALERLRGEQIVWLTTTSPNGTPQPSPVWFLWDDGELIVFSQPETPKVRAINRNGRVSLNFNATEHGGDVEIFQGAATVVASGPSATDFPAYIAKYSSGLQSLNMTPETFAGDYSQLIRVVPDRLRGFS